MSEVDLAEDRLFPLGWGLIFRAVCAPKTWSEDRVSEQVTRDDPPGTSANRWVISGADNGRVGAFKGTNCISCPDSPDRQHWLLNC